MGVIKFTDVAYKYPISTHVVLERLNFTLERSKIHAIIGCNGSGKTTLCNIMRGFIPHFYQGDLSGEILVDGKDIRNYHLYELASKIGYVFQNSFNQISGIKDTVYSEIAYSLENLGVPVDQINQRVEKILVLFGLQELKNRNPSSLSGGQMQKVAIASVAVMDSDIFIFDEPTSQLDPYESQEIFKIIYMMKEMGKTIIIAEHNSKLIAEYADHVIMLHNQTIQSHSTCRKIFSDADLSTYGVSVPEYVLLAQCFKKNGFSVESIPITKRETLNMIRSFLKGEKDD